MKTHIKDSSLEGRLTRSALLVLVGGILISSAFFLRSATASPAHPMGSQHATRLMQAQDTLLTRLDIIGISNGHTFRKLSDDNGVSWSDAHIYNGGSRDGDFYGPPAAVSDGVGHLTAFLRIGTNGTLGILYETFSDGAWSGTAYVPGSLCLSNGCYTSMSNPAASSWGPGRFDLFVNATNTTNGSIALLHTWADNSTWVGHWEVLGTGLMQGGPTAVSWAPGRIDVFVRGGGDELSHKWFDNGHWSSGWEDLGGTMTSGPSVSSPFPGALIIVARNANGGLETRGFGSGGWGAWVDVDSNTIGDNPLNSAPSGVALPGGVLHVFATDPTGHEIYNRMVDGNWTGWSVLNIGVGSYGGAVGVAWHPFAPPPPEPTPTPPNCGRRGQPPCP